MATWVMHLMMAETLLNKGYPFEVEQFLIGNVAPDVGASDDFHKPFDPPRHITHWENENHQIEAERFYAHHIKGKSLDDPMTSFMIGYYFHLLADIHWRKTIWRPRYLHPEYGERLQDDPYFHEEMYRDITAFDHVYLRDHPDFIYHTRFKAYHSVTDYFDYVPVGRFTSHLEHIHHSYSTPPFDLTDYLYPYFKPEELEHYVVEATQILDDAIQLKEWFEQD